MRPRLAKSFIREFLATLSRSLPALDFAISSSQMKGVVRGMNLKWRYDGTINQINSQKFRDFSASLLVRRRNYYFAVVIGWWKRNVEKE